MSGAIYTSAFTIAPGVYARRDMAAIAERHWWMPALPILVCGAMAIDDWRWAVVALALLFVATPMVAMFVWISLLGKPAAIRDLKPHTLTIFPNGQLAISWEGNAHPIIEVPITDIESVNSGHRHIFIRYTSPNVNGKERNDRHPHQSTEIAIPIAAFASQQDAATAYASISASVTAASRNAQHDGV